MKKLTLAAAVAAMSLSAQAETSIGGYGELHYNNVSNNDNSDDKREIDFHRFVLFFGHEFSDEIRFFSEFELEHSLAGDGKPGEVELEQAYVEMDVNDNTQFKAGLFLVPVGILNETHEPPTFYGVERNTVEAQIIPATWWEAGLGVTGQFGEGFSYDVALHSGLDVSGSVESNIADVASAPADNSPNLSIRSGRQKVAEANGRNGAVSARIKYTGISGLELATTLQYQSDLAPAGSGGESAVESAINDATLVEAHARYNVGDLTLTGLFAQWDIDIDNTIPAAYSDFDSQTGYYVEAAYKLTDNVGVALRHDSVDKNSASDAEELTVLSLNYWPHENVVFKADIQDENQAGGDLDGFNLGVGYNF
jgi:hypothetical protein